jgi:hypothetical protein
MSVMAAALRRFAMRCGGSMTIPAIVFFAALMGVGGLAIDLQRYYGVHGQMQAYVDGVALAAADELDGQSGAITRAWKAAIGTGGAGPLLTSAGWQSFNTLNTSNARTNALNVRKLIVLSQLGSPDPSPTDGSEPHAVDSTYVLCTITGGAAVPSGCDTNSSNEKNAQFVEVIAETRSVSYIVLPIANVFGAGSIANPQLALRADAGFKATVCDINPMMICNPAEPANNMDVNYPFDPTAYIGHQILLVGGGGSAWTPGNFGLVSVPAGNPNCQSNNGKKETECEAAVVDPFTQCLPTNTIDIDPLPGNPQGLYDAINVRFDIYPNNNKIGNSITGASTNPLVAPSINMTKGICNVSGNSCNYGGQTTCPNPNNGFNPSNTVSGTKIVPLPRDNTWCTDGTFTSCVGTPDGSHRFGSGMTLPQRQNYWSSNHGVPLPPALNSASRYDMYRYEINNSQIPDGSGNGGENGNKPNSVGNGKFCSNQAGINNANRDRRVLYVAVVNCHASGLNGNSVNNVKAVAYLKVFLTEPVGFPLTGQTSFQQSNQNVFGEVIDVVKPSDPSGILHVYPVLYR